MKQLFIVNWVKLKSDKQKQAITITDSYLSYMAQSKVSTPFISLTMSMLGKIFTSDNNKMASTNTADSSE